MCWGKTLFAIFRNDYKYINYNGRSKYIKKSKVKKSQEPVLFKIMFIAP